MNSFTLEILEDGVWKNPCAVFPFTVGELLDERLDEGNVVFFSSTPEYKPLTEVRISFFKDGEPDYDADGNYIDYFITANDNAVEYPSGSGRYASMSASENRCPNAQVIIHSPFSRYPSRREKLPSPAAIFLPRLGFSAIISIIKDSPFPQIFAMLFYFNINL